MPKVSIITPCYNSDRYIGRTIASVQSQTFTDWEHIIVDDGSNDSSASIVQKFAAKDKRLSLIQQANGGVAKARNIGFNAASKESKYLLFLDADDCLKSEMLEIMSNYLDQHLDVGLVYCGCSYIDANDLPIATPHFPRYAPSRFSVYELSDEQPETPFVSIFTLAPIIPSKSLIRRFHYEQTPGWDEAFGQHYEDTDMFINISLNSKVHYLPWQLLLHRRHDQQSTSDTRKFASQEQKLYQKWLNLETLTKEQKLLVKSGWQFRERRLISFIGWQAGNRHLQQGEINQALRFYIGAFRRYLWFFPSLVISSHSHKHGDTTT